MKATLRFAFLFKHSKQVAKMKKAQEKRIAEAKLARAQAIRAAAATRDYKPPEPLIPLLPEGVGEVRISEPSGENQSTIQIYGDLPEEK